jgi:molybdate transport system regulatory protein
VALIAAIGASGSITQAAKAVHMSYKAAWDAIDTMNNLAGAPLVERVTGGKGGGGTRLTARGRQLVDNFEIIERAHRRFVEQLEALGREAGAVADDGTGTKGNPLTDDMLLIRRMGLKTSARNQFLGRVSSVTVGAVNDEIVLDLAGGQQLVAVVTHDSTEGLGLAVGAQAFALIKASSIILVTENDGARFSARNQLRGTVARVQPGAVNTEVVLGLDGGATLAAVVTNRSSEALALQPGARATAIFKASSIILGVPA